MIESEFVELCALASSFLESVELDDYYGPSGPIDDAISALCSAVAALTPDQCDRFARLVHDKGERIFGRYALRAPMLALRAEAPDHLQTGLLAHALVSRKVFDWRDDLVFFAPYYHVSRRLDLSPESLFDGAATCAIPDMARIMRAFGRRTDITVAAFGWRQIDTPNGPSFETVDWHDRPTGAVVGERAWNEVNQAQADVLLKWVAEQRRSEKEGRGDK